MNSISTYELWTLQRGRGGSWLWGHPKLGHWTVTNTKVSLQCLLFFLRIDPWENYLTKTGNHFSQQQFRINYKVKDQAAQSASSMLFCAYFTTCQPRDSWCGIERPKRKWLAAQRYLTAATPAVFICVFTKTASWGQVSRLHWKTQTTVILWLISRAWSLCLVRETIYKVGVLLHFLLHLQWQHLIISLIKYFTSAIYRQLCIWFVC